MVQPSLPAGLPGHFPPVFHHLSSPRSTDLSNLFAQFAELFQASNHYFLWKHLLWKTAPYSHLLKGAKHLCFRFALLQSDQSGFQAVVIWIQVSYIERFPDLYKLCFHLSAPRFVKALKFHLLARYQLFPYLKLELLRQLPVDPAQFLPACQHTQGKDWKSETGKESESTSDYSQIYSLLTPLIKQTEN